MLMQTNAADVDAHLEQETNAPIAVQKFPPQ